MDVSRRLLVQIEAVLLAGCLAWSTGAATSGAAAAAGPPANDKSAAATRRGASPAADPQNQSLGSLSGAGDVFAGGNRVPGELTIYKGDDIRVGEGMATFTAAGQKGSIAIFPQSEVIFTGDARFVAELRAGRAGMRSSSGPSGAALRTGNFIIVDAVQGQESAATVERMADGSFLIDCTEGSIGVVPLAGGNGLFFQPGQSARITPQGQLIPLTTLNGTASTTPPPAVKRGTRTGLWVLLGAGGTAGLVAAIVLATHHPPPITPDSP